MESIAKYILKSAEPPNARDINEITSCENGKASDILINLVKKSAHVISPLQLATLLFTSIVRALHLIELNELNKTVPFFYNLEHGKM